MIGETYRGPLKCIPINGVREVSFGVYYLKSQLEKQAKDMLRILKKIYANKSTASWRYSAVSVAKKIISGRPQVARSITYQTMGT